MRILFLMRSEECFQPVLRLIPSRRALLLCERRTLLLYLSCTLSGHCKLLKVQQSNSCSFQYYSWRRHEACSHRCTRIMLKTRPFRDGWFKPWCFLLLLQQPGCSSCTAILVLEASGSCSSLAAANQGKNIYILVNAFKTNRC